VKIALVSPYDFAYPGGVTNHVSCLAREFNFRGHTVKILAPCSNDPSGPDGIEVVKCGRPVPVPSAGSVARVSLSLWLNPKIKSVLKNEQFDIVHIHEPFMPMVPLAAVYHSPAPTIGTFHAFNEHTRRYWMWKPLLNRVAKRLDGRIAVSPAARDYVSHHYPGDYKIIPNGVDIAPQNKSNRPFKELDDGRINILFVGRMEKRKGLRYLLGAYSTLKWEFPDLRLIVVGPGRMDSDTARMFGERNMKDVIITGSVSEKDKGRYFSSAHIFCSPATGLESFGMVLIEAMATGKPIVASDIGGYSSVVTHGKQGLLVEPRNESALAEALRTLIENPAQRIGMGNEGLNTVEQYRWDRIADRVIAYYDTVLNRVAARQAIVEI